MRLFVFFGGLIVLALLVALIGPYFVDWGTYKDRFEAEASRILGQEVQVEGTASARLLPFPSVTFSDVRVGPKGAPNITVEQFSMDAELAPFLSGEILIFDMRFVSPVIRLDLDDEGRPVWNWPSQTPVDPAQITLENARFTDGTIILRDRGEGRQWDFVSLEGTAAASNLFGPWRIEGTGLVRGEPFEARVSSGNLNREGFSARMTAVLPNNNIEVTTEGRIAPPSAEIPSWYSGTFSLKPNSRNTQNYFLEGLFEADARSMRIEQFRGDFGDQDDPYSINGSASISGGSSPQFSLEAKGNQVSLEAEDDVSQPIALTGRFSDIQSVLSALPFPPIPGTIKLDLPAIVAGKTTIRDVRLAAEPVAGNKGRKWSVRRLEAKLPGRTVLEAKGELTLAGRNEAMSKNSFVGDVVVASRQPSGLAAWLTDDVDEIIRLLPNAGFSAAVDLTSDRQIFEGLELIVGPARLNGRVIRKSSDETLPYLTVELAGSNAQFETMQALASLMVGKNGGPRVVDHDVDVSLDLRDAQISGIEIGQIDTSFRVRGERVEVDRISVNELFGAAISATATVQPNKAEGASGYLANWDSILIASEGASFIDGVAEHFGDLPGLNALQKMALRDGAVFRDTSLNIVGNAIIPEDANAESSASISGSFGGSDVSLTTTVRGNFADAQSIMASLAGTISNEEASTLLSQAGFEVFPIRLLGAGQTEVNLSGSLRDGLSMRVALKTADSLVSSTGIFQAPEGKVRYDGVGQIVTEDAEPWFDLFGYIFPDTGLGTPLLANAQLAYESQKLVLKDFTGEIAENSFSGSIRVSNEKSRPEIEGALRLDHLNLGFMTAFLTGRYDLTDGSGLFDEPLYSDHALDIQLELKELGLIERSIKDARFRMVLKDGALSLLNVDGAFAGGKFAGSLDAQNNNGSILVNSQIALNGVDLTQLIPASDLSIEAQGGLTLALTGTGKSIEAMLNSLTGSGVLIVKSASLQGVNNDVVSPILQSADQIGYEITDQQINDIAKSVAEIGVIEISPRELPVSVTTGNIDIDNISVPLDAVNLSGELSLSLPKQTVSGEVRLTYDAGIERIAGAQPEVAISLSQEEPGGVTTVARDYAPLASFVRQRALEKEQSRVEALQARLLEKQRLRRAVRYLKYLQKEQLTRDEERRLRELGKRRRDALIEEGRRREAGLNEALKLIEGRQVADEKVILEENEIESELAGQAVASEPENSETEGNQSPIDSSLLDDPLAPIPNSANIFKDVELQLAN